MDNLSTVDKMANLNVSVLPLKTLHCSCDRSHVSHMLCFNYVCLQNGWTALHYGAYKGNVDLVKLLLHHGCDVDKLTSDGKWAGALAEEEGHDLCAEELKKARGLVSNTT